MTTPVTAPSGRFTLVHQYPEDDELSHVYSACRTTGGSARMISIDPAYDPKNLTLQQEDEILALLDMMEAFDPSGSLA